MENLTIDRNTMIRVNVPGTSGFYRLRCEAFFTVTKGQFSKMLKALKADAETAAADPEKLEPMPETMPETMTAEIPTKTAQNRTEGNDGISYKACCKTSVYQPKTGVTGGIEKYTYSRQTENAIPAGIEKMSNCTNYTIYTIITNYHNMPVMHMNDNMNNPHKLHNSMGTGFPSALSALEKIPFCDGKNAFCDIPSGVPPGPPGMRVSSRWNHPSSA